MAPAPSDTVNERSESTVDTMFEALSNAHRRAILSYLAERSDAAVDYDDVVAHLTERPSFERDPAALQAVCHHVHFPKLDRAGLLEHDVDDLTVRLPREPSVERVVSLLLDFEEAEE